MDSNFIAQRQLALQVLSFQNFLNTFLIYLKNQLF